MVTEEFLYEKVQRNYITRKEICKYTGLISVQGLSNFDSKGEGIKNSSRICNKVVYPLIDVVNFFIERTYKNEVKI